MTNADRAQLDQLLTELRTIAMQARQRAAARQSGDLPAAYHYGAAFGYEDAADRLDVLLRDLDLQQGN